MEVHVIDEDRALVVDAPVEWASEDPSLLLIDAEGTMTAQGVSSILISAMMDTVIDLSGSMFWSACCNADTSRNVRQARVSSPQKAMQKRPTPMTTLEMTSLGQLLRTSKAAQLAEMVVVFAVATAVIIIAIPLVGNNPLARQGVVWVANVLMLALVWLGLRLRGQRWEHFGLHFRFGDRRTVLRTVLQSVAVFVAAVAAFVLGSIIMATLTGTPEAADMSGYTYLRGNLPMLILALIAVYIVSSLGEEVIYRGFLINRLAELGSGGTWALRAAVGGSSIVFGLVHYDWGLTGIVQTGFMGLALGISYLVVRRNLWVLILAHAYMDTILLVQMYLPAG